METLVVDASVVVQACLESDGFAPLAGHRLVGPDLVFSEALSALHEAAWRGEISDDLAGAARARLLHAPIERIQLAGQLSVTWDVADALGWAKTYDAEYVALAQLLDCRLLTIDARLARGAGRAVRIVGPTEI